MSRSPSALQPVITGNEEIGKVIAGYVNSCGLQLQTVPPIIQ